MFDRGHLDHLALDVASRGGVTDGAVTDLGPQLSSWFGDPDGMHIEVDRVRGPSLQGFHAPVPVEEAQLCGPSARHPR